VRAKAPLSEVEAGLPRLARLPALILWADRDFAFKNEARSRWQDLLPRHSTHVLAGAGHFFQDDAGDETAAAIREWWSSPAGPGQTGN